MKRGEALERIGRIQDMAFEGDSFQGIPELLVGLVELTLSEGLIDVADGGVMAKFNGALTYAMNAMERGDYLFVCDLLEYELKPLVSGPKGLVQ